MRWVTKIGLFGMATGLLFGCEEAVEIVIPVEEKLCTIIDETRTAYSDARLIDDKAARNLAKDTARLDRRDRMKDLLGDGILDDWNLTFVDSDDLVVAYTGSFELPCDVTFTSVKVAKSSGLGSALRELPRGAGASVSGWLMPAKTSGRDAFQEASLTEKGGMEAPIFLLSVTALNGEVFEENRRSREGGEGN